MVSSFNKFVTKMIDGKEYSTGMRIKILNITVEELPKKTMIYYEIDLINEEDQPYDLYVVMENIKYEINELSRYMSFHDFNKEIEIVVDIKKDEFIYFSKEFKRLLYENISDISYIKFDDNRVYTGKFLPRIELKSVQYNMEILFHFKMNDVNKEEKQELQDEIDDKLYFGLEIGDTLKDKVTKTMNNWERNFFLDDPEYHYDMPDEIWQVAIKIV